MYSIQYFRLTFNEANILMENIKGCTKSELLIRIEMLYKNTSDDILRQSTQSLLKKIVVLSENEYAKLLDDASKGRILYPPNYSIDYM